MSVAVTTPWRLRIAFLALVVLASIVGWRLFVLQVQQQDSLRGWGKQISVRSEVVPAFRGNIYDRTGRVLAMSTPGVALAIDPSKAPEAKQWVGPVAERLGVDPVRLAQRFEAAQGRQHMYIRRNLTPAEASHVMDLEVPGLIAESESQRYYPGGEAAGHIVGFTDVDGRGREGLEFAFNQHMAPSQGERRILIDRERDAIRYLPGGSDEQFGHDLHLSLDADLQYAAYRALKRAALRTRAESGSAVVLDAKTGEILAAASYPSFNPNNMATREPERTRPRFVADLFEPGSTIKPFAVALALQERVVEPDEVIETPRFFKVNSHRVSDTKNYEQLDVAGIIQKSSNVGTAKLMLRMDSQALPVLLRRAGLGEDTGLALPAEALGGVPNRTRWSDIGRASLGYGYGLSVNAVQLAQAYTAFANQGQVRPVTLVQGLPSLPPVQLFESHIADDMLRMMAAVTAPGGTAQQAKIPGYTSAGKTGTTIKAGTQGYLERRYVGSFAGLFPATDPRLVVVVSIDDPKGSNYYGGNTAAPAFAEITREAARILNIPPDEPETLLAGGAN